MKTRLLILAGAIAACLILLPLAAHAAAQKGVKELLDENGQPKTPLSDAEALLEAAIRLPASALLGAALAFRPRRRGTPPRNPAVIQTQILLAVVGALVMMVVGSSLARAFGIVGAAGLIRYRAKIEDPKDAGVMLAALGVGLAAGVGLYLLAAFGTAFFLLLLGVVESLNEDQKVFDLTVHAEQIETLRPGLETLLRRQGVDYELRTSAEDSLCYAVRLPLDRRTDRLSAAINRLAPGRVTSVGWEERKVK
jgi:uncharacterized membrane protein YhiD involved in acid resistance